MRKALLIGALLGASALGGCAQFQQFETDVGFVTSATVPASAAVVAANSFDAIEATATNYLRLPTCSGSASQPICKTQVAVNAIVPAIRSGRGARNAIESLLAKNNNGAIPVATYDTLTSAVSVLQNIYSQYNIQSK